MAKTTETIEYRFEGDASGLTSAAAKAKDKLKGVEDQSGKTSAKMEGLKFAAQGAGGKVGELAGRAENMGRAFGMLGAVGGPLLLAGAAVAGVGLAGLAMGAAMVKGTQMAVDAVVGITRAGGAAVETFAKLEGAQGFTTEQVARIEAANEALDGVGFMAQKVYGILAANMAPTVELIATDLVALGLIGIDTFTSLTAGADILAQGLNLVGQWWSTINLSPLLFLLRGMDALNSLTGVHNNHIKEVIGTIEGWQETIDNGVVPALDRLSHGAMAGYFNKAGEFIAATADMTDATDAQVVAVEKLNEVMSIQDKMNNAPKGVVKPKPDNATDKEAVIAAQELAIAKAAAADASEEQAKSEVNYTAALQGTSQLVGALPALFKKGTKAAAVATKASALSQAAINTALSITSALTIPPPVGPALAVANGIAGAIQIGVIQNTAIPANAGGGVVMSDAPRWPMDGRNERMVTARPGEVIYTPEQVAAMSGGGMGGGATIVNMLLDNRVVGQSVVDSERQGRSISRALGVSPLRQRGR